MEESIKMEAVEHMLNKHVQQIKALKDQLYGQWLPLHNLLKLDSFEDDVRAKIPAFCEIIPMEDYLAEQAPKMELKGKYHWLRTLGVQYLMSQRYCFGWEDLEYHPRETVKYLLEARQGMLDEILKIIGTSGEDRVFYLSKVELVVNITNRVEIYLKALYKAEE